MSGLLVDAAAGLAMTGIGITGYRWRQQLQRRRRVRRRHQMKQQTRLDIRRIERRYQEAIKAAVRHSTYQQRRKEPDS